MSRVASPRHSHRRSSRLKKRFTGRRAARRTTQRRWRRGNVARLDRNIAYAGLLPSVTYNNSALYTEPQRPYSRSSAAPGSSEPLPVYIANNAPREYVSQGTVSETIGLASVASARREAALAAQAAAEQEIARRGLVSAVVSLFYGSLAADHKLAVAERARSGGCGLYEADRSASRRGSRRMPTW